MYNDLTLLGAPGKELDGSCTLTTDPDVFVQIIEGKLDAQSAWASGIHYFLMLSLQFILIKSFKYLYLTWIGKLSLDGNMMIAMKLQVLFQAKSKL